MDREIHLSFARMRISTQFIGADLLITVSGGERSHIGTAVLAVPRPSLTGDGSASATSSVMNVVGHKDETICRMLAEKAARKYGVTVLCAGGFHVDNMTAGQIGEVVEAIRSFDV